MFAPFGCWWYMVALEHVTDRGTPDIIPQFAKLTFQLAVAPPRVLFCETQDQRYGLSGNGWSAQRCDFFLKIHFRRTSSQCHLRSVSGLNRSTTWLRRVRALVVRTVSLPARTTNVNFSKRVPWCVGLLPLENTELLPQQQNFNILVLLGSTTQPDEVEQQGEHMGEKKEKHVGRCCRDHAERRDYQENRMMCGTLKTLWKASDILFTLYGVEPPSLRSYGTAHRRNLCCGFACTPYPM